MGAESAMEGNPDGVPSLEEELVDQFGPNILGDLAQLAEVTDEMEEEEAPPDDPTESTEDFGNPEDVYDEVPMDLRWGAHHISSSSEDEDDEV